MPDIWMDVDTALSEVPVNIFPLIDDTDFKTRETAVAYNAAGMDLVWNFVTPAGAFTQAAVTPTSGGNYDWTHQGDGMYTIEIPASGGASINNDTEGFGWFTGVCTGVLPWRGPIIGFRRAALNDLLIEGSTASTNMEDFFDGTGYAGGTTPLNVNVSSISNNAITAASIATGAIDADAIADNAIDAGAIATGAITAAKFASGAIDAAALAADAGSEIATAVWASATRTVTSAANITSTGGTVTLDGSGYVTYANAAPPTAAAIADAVWDESTTGHTTAGTFGAQCATDIDAILDDTGTSGVVVGSIANNAITAAAIATGAIDADALAADAGTEIGTAVWATTTRTLTAATNITSTGGTVTLDGSGYVTYANAAPPTAAAIADAVWDEARADHTSSGTFGQGVSSVQGNVTGSVASVAGNVGGNVTGSVGSISGVTFPSNFADLAITSSTGRVTVGTNTDKTGYSISGTKTTLDALNDITAASVWSAATRTLTSAENITSTGGTTVPQTGDAYARIGSNGSGLTGIPWNSSWDAEVQSEVFDALDAAYTDATSLTSNGLLDRIRILCWILRNKIEVTDANGNTVIYKDDSTTTAFSVNSMLTDDSTTTTRLRAA